jgi:low temperature requirement protein LtrA
MVGATAAIQAAFEARGFHWDLVGVIIGGLVIALGMWWAYFAVPAHERLTDNKAAFFWGYGHYFVFASIAAFGAGLALEVARDTTPEAVGPRAAAAAVTIPDAVFMIVVWALHLRRDESLPAFIAWLTPLGALCVLAASLAGAAAVPLAGAVTVVLLWLKVALVPDWGVAAGRRQ